MEPSSLGIKVLEMRVKYVAAEPGRDSTMLTLEHRKMGAEMAEAGGPTTQSGIYYQNTIAARYLGTLLDLRSPSAAGASRTTSVRVEAPEHIDDTIVEFSDGHKLFIQAKEDLSTSGDAWEKFWLAAKKQASNNPALTDEFRLIVGKVSTALQNLREVLDRARGKESFTEWHDSLSLVQRRVARAVITAVGTSDNDGFTIAQRVTLEFLTLEDAEKFGARDWMPNSSESKPALLSHLRDLCGGYSRVRRTFVGGELSEKLLKEFQIRVFGSPGNELERYRLAITQELDQISIPSTAVSASESELFVWPDICVWDRNTRNDFEDEDNRQTRAERIDFRQFPSADLRLVVLESGAGQGKSTILRATARRIAAATGHIPALLHAEDAARFASLTEYLEREYNSNYDLSIDWQGLCTQGRATLIIDGIDEVDDGARAKVVEMVVKASALFAQTAFLIGARDSSIASLPAKFRLLRVQSLNDEQTADMLKRYLWQKSEERRQEVLVHVHTHPELKQLCRVPLFLGIFAATLPETGYLPTSRTELLEHYILLAISAARHKGTRASPVGKVALRKGASAIALLAFRKDQRAVRDSDARERSGDECLDALVQCGILQRRHTRVAFALPTVQEYLAGCELADSGEINTTDLLSGLYRRSWAQSIQFAIERLDSAELLLRSQLDQADDVFNTSLRFVGRCIVNGAHVTPDLVNDVADRLFDVWGKAPYMTSERIGQLIVDGFSLPLRPKLREILLAPHGHSYERATILRRINSTTLTLECLSVLLVEADIRELRDRDWCALLNCDPLPAIQLLLKRARDTSELWSHNVIAGVLFHLRGSSIDWHSIADDSTLPHLIRAAAEFGLDGGPSSPAILELALSEAEEAYLWDGFQAAYISTSWWKEHLRFSCGVKNGKNDRTRVLDALFHDDEIASELIKELEAIANAPETASSCRLRLSIMLGGHSVGNFSETTTKLLSSIDTRYLFSWIAETPYLPEDQVISGIGALRDRKLPIENQLRLLEQLARNTMCTPSEPRRSALPHGPFRPLAAPGPSAASALAWAEHLMATGQLTANARRDLTLLCAEMKSPRWLKELDKLVSEYIDEHSDVPADDWTWFASSVRTIVQAGDVERTMRRRVWEMIPKCEGHPVHWLLSSVLELPDAPSHDVLLRYLSNGESREAKRAIIWYFERASERLGLRLEKKGTQYELTSMR